MTSTASFKIIVTISLALMTVPAQAASRVALQASGICATCLNDQASADKGTLRNLAQQVNIFVEDTRKEVAKDAVDPAAAATGNVVTNRKIQHDGRLSQLGGGTFMVAPCLALTARHVVFGDEAADDKHFNVSLSIGSNGQGGPKWVIQAKPVVWGADNTGGSDWALLHLEHCAGVDKSIGWMDWGKAEANLDVKMTGIQGDKTFGTLWNSQGQLREASVDHTFNHDLPAVHGSSGNPIYTIRESGVPVLRGLNTGASKHYDEILPKYQINLANKAIDADYIYQQVAAEVQDNIAWFKRTYPDRENPQVAMAKAGRTQLAQNNL